MPVTRTSGAGSRWQALVEESATLELRFDDLRETEVHLGPSSGPCALEDESFPFEMLSDIAERESWRKEINRPTTHIHKWWAQRLGTVFRAIVIGAFAPRGTDLLDLFYRPVRIPGRVVFDPFMGSGTTMAETVKLGARGIGRDINPVAHFLVKCALSVHDSRAVLDTFKAVERDVAERIRSHYRTSLPDGTSVDVLYYFWVKTVPCPSCATSVDLFSSRIFARNADPRKSPRAQAVCPSCGGINEIHIQDKETRCSSCAEIFDPRLGPANGRTATCPSCSQSFPIARTVRAGDGPPDHRLYAKLVLRADGTKTYLPATDLDRDLFIEAREQLGAREDPYPVVAISPGYNTNQALGYQYKYWHEMFNARQLLCLSILADRVRSITDPALRDLFTCLFTGALEFNNMFASFKGEGTGAVRHMFAHHIIKPERVPLEANLWGTPRSSGSFSTMFEGRIRRALDYADNPFEIRLGSTGTKKTAEKVYGLSEKIGSTIAECYADFAEGDRVYLSCGDSSATDLPNASVDAIVTDPPFFDNVHYSQLADFFHVWQRHILGADGYQRMDTTRSDREVQNPVADDFAARLSSVWSEAFRVLKENGLLTFTYHHSRPEGWRCVLSALMDAGFGITAAHPIKAEMSVAMPKLQAREPINLDIIVVCRKRSQIETRPWDAELWGMIAKVATDQTRRLIDSGRRLSRNDVRVIVMAQLLRQLSVSTSTAQALSLLDGFNEDANVLIGRLHALQCSSRKQDGVD